MTAEELWICLVLSVILLLSWHWLKRWGRRESEKRYASMQRAENWTAWAGARVRQSQAPLSAAPDAPVSFGDQTSWLAVRCAGSERVVEAIGLPNTVPANWAAGMPHAGTDGVFVSPPLDGFVLVADGGILPDEVPGAWERLLDTFPEVQLYASHRVSDYYRWERYVDGALVRSCCWADGQITEDVGPLTPEEQAVMLAWLDHGDFPNEEAVLDIAAAWGVDPRFAKKPYQASTGWVCTL